MPVELFDFSYDRLTPDQVRAAGRAGIIRYVASNRPAVSATRQEVDAFRHAGLVFCGVWQNGKDRALGGAANGLVDARDALTYTTGLGATSVDPVYLAVDVDISTPAQLAAVLAYFRAAAPVLGWHRLGAYGDWDVIQHLNTHTPMALFWQSAATAHSGGRLHPAACLHQYATRQFVAGKEVDYDRALKPDYGQWGKAMLKSSERSGAPVLWITLHTAEGAFDDDPANPSVDPGSVDNLRNFFADPNTQASSHAGCDDDRLSDGWVPYERASWTLRGGNSISDNLEMCGRAGWNRAQWMTHRPMIRNAAKWAASRCQARNIPVRRLTVAQVAARNMTGIIDHNTYTQATGDGTHWDVGPGFPWDVFLGDVNAFMQGVQQEEDDMAIFADRDEFDRAVYAQVTAATREVVPRALSRAMTGAGNSYFPGEGWETQNLKAQLAPVGSAVTASVASHAALLATVQQIRADYAASVESLRRQLEGIAAYLESVPSGQPVPVTGELTVTGTVVGTARPVQPTDPPQPQPDPGPAHHEEPQQ